MMRNISVFFLAMTICFSCTPVPEDVPVGPSTLKEVTYGNDSLQRMDIYLPKDRKESKTKTLFTIHGGGWKEGDKKDFDGFVAGLQTYLPDYAIVNLNYRLAANGTNLFPTQEQDVKAAIAFYLDRTSTYKVSKNIVLLGMSAGAHLALLHGYKNDSGHHVRAIINYFGPTDLTKFIEDGQLQEALMLEVIGATQTSAPEKYTQSSPVTFITSTSPPTLTFQGENDPLVPIAQAVILDDKLKENSVPHEFVRYQGGHGDWPLETYADSFDKIKSFISQYAP